jgi:phosphate starvation-inducible protein PhoH
MKKIKTKLSNLHKIFNVNEYEKEVYLTEDVYIESLDDTYVRINALVKKQTPMLEVEIDGIPGTYECAEKHIIMTSDGWKFMIDTDHVLNKNTEQQNIISKKQVGIKDSYDVSLDDPHIYCTADGLVHHNTFLALYKALEEVLSKDNTFKQIVVVRSAVQVRDQGYVPGTLDEKMEIYETPYKEICGTLFGRADAWDRLKEQGYARFISTTAIRGISIDDSIIIVDESQSATLHELNSVISRCGYRSKIIFVGDLKQNDLIKSKNDVSGLKDFMNIARHMSSFSEITFTPDDIVRSSLVKEWIIACEKLGY